MACKGCIGAGKAHLCVTVNKNPKMVRSSACVLNKFFKRNLTFGTTSHKTISRRNHEKE